MGSRSTSEGCLLVLDVDGTIARVYREEEYADHANDPGWTSWMAVDQAVVDALDLVAKRPGVRVAWLTTWSPDQVSWLITGPLRGKLAGKYVPHRAWPQPGWRRQSLVSFIRELRPTAVAWADDRADEEFERTLTAIVEVPTLVVRPDKFSGLQLADVESIGRFVERLQRS